MELLINGTVLQKSDVFLKTLSGNQSKKINKQFIIKNNDLDSTNNNIDICFKDFSDTLNNIFLFTDNHTLTQGDTDVNITLTEIGTTNTLYGPSINSLPIGDSNPSTGKFTTLENTGVMTMSNHIIPNANAQYDLGNAEYKIRHLFLSDNSLWIGDQYKLGIEGTQFAIRKRKLNKVPKAITDIDNTVNLNHIKAHVGKSGQDDSKLTLQDFVKYGRSRNISENNLKIENLFNFNDRTNDSEFEEIDVLDSTKLGVGSIGIAEENKALIVDQNRTISHLSKVGIGTNNPLHELHIVGNANITGSLYANGSTGTSGQVLKSNGSSLYWDDESGGGGSGLWSQSGTTITTAYPTNINGNLTLYGSDRYLYFNSTSNNFYIRQNFTNTESDKINGIEFTGYGGGDGNSFASHRFTASDANYGGRVMDLYPKKVDIHKNTTINGTLITTGRDTDDEIMSKHTFMRTSTVTRNNRTYPAGEYYVGFCSRSLINTVTGESVSNSGYRTGGGSNGGNGEPTLRTDYSYLFINCGHKWVGYFTHYAYYGVIDFTGQHRSKIINIDEDNINNYIGLIVVSTGNYDNLEVNASEFKPTINEALPIVELSKKKKDKTVYGVLSNIEDKNNQEREYALGNFVSVYPKKENDNRVYINSLGEGGIWIVNTNGNLENGDYIQSSDIVGYGEKQDSEFLANYTVAKITCDCEFDLNSSKYDCFEINNNGTIYKKAFVGCTYHCG